MGAFVFIVCDLVVSILQVPESAVQARRLDQLFVGADLCYMFVFYNDDFIGVHEC